MTVYPGNVGPPARATLQVILLILALRNAEQPSGNDSCVLCRLALSLASTISSLLFSKFDRSSLGNGRQTVPIRAVSPTSTALLFTVEEKP